MSEQLPKIFVVGAAKAGSTWLADRLREHPDVFVPPEKELHFFSVDSNWANGLDWYRAFFAGARDGQIWVDATPQTMMFNESLRRVAELVPDAKLLAIVRDPAERLYSNWRHVYYRTVTEERPFAKFVEDELKTNPDLPPRDRCDPAAIPYVTNGLYRAQLDQVLEHFSREQLHVVVLEDVERDPAGVLDTVWRFLELAPPPATDKLATISNPHKEFRPLWLWRFIVRRQPLARFPVRVGKWVAARMARTSASPPPIEPRVRAQLDEFYAEPNASLAEFLGRELPGWAMPR